MNKLICKDTRGYKLTLDGEYDLIKKEEGFVFLVNDSGKTVRYAADMFKEVKAGAKVPVEVIVKRTEQDCIDSIIVEDGYCVTYTDIKNKNITFGVNFDFHDSSISCGIKELININSTIAVIEENIDTSEDDFIDLKKALFKESFLEYIKTEDCAMFIVSTNVSGEDEGVESDEDIIQLLNEMSHFTSKEVNNPNSGNNIKLWGFYPNEL